MLRCICQVSQVPLQSGDLPRFAICPQPSLNVSALQNLTGFSRALFNQTAICKIDGCQSLDTFGHFVEENGMDSKEVDEFYNDLKFTASEVVHSLTVQLQNSEKVAIDIDNMDNAKYMLPLYEMGDCPVYRIPEGLGDASKIVWVHRKNSDYILTRQGFFWERTQNGDCGEYIHIPEAGFTRVGSFQASIISMLSSDMVGASSWVNTETKRINH